MTDSYLATSALPERLVAFTDASLDWCKRESESSAIVIMQAIDALLKKTERVASISSESLHALTNLQGLLGTHLGGEQKEKNLTNLTQSLESLSRQHREVGGVIGPVIEALQYQDLLRQNLENIVKLLRAWVSLRARAHSKSLTMVELGEALLSCMTTVDERAVIRNHIDGLPEESVLEGQVAMF